MKFKEILYGIAFMIFFISLGVDWVGLLLG